MAFSFEEGVQGRGLRRGAWESVKDESGGFRVLVHLRFQHADGHVVGNELTLIHVAFGQVPQLRFSLDVGAKNVSSAEVNQVVVLHQKSTLGALPCPWRAKQNQVPHRCVPFVDSLGKMRR